METLLVFADFDFIGSPALIGELGYESLRGSDSYSFRFVKEVTGAVKGWKSLATRLNIPKMEIEMFEPTYNLCL